MNGKETSVEVNENWRENGLIYIEIICPFGKQTDFWKYDRWEETKFC